MTGERKKSIIAILILLLFSSLIVSGCNSEPPVPHNVSETNDIDGFPPQIPHELEGRGDCLVCHRDGEVGKTPKTPHPELTTCRQCHVLTDELN